MNSPVKSWTDARFKSFIVSALRNASNRFPNKYETLKEARVERGKYKCKGYGKKSHIVNASIKVNGKTKKNIYADHISPVVDPATGFVDWNTFIPRLFCIKEGFQALCLDCHSKKSADERIQRNKK